MLVLHRTKPLEVVFDIGQDVQHRIARFRGIADRRRATRVGVWPARINAGSVDRSLGAVVQLSIIGLVHPDPLAALEARSCGPAKAQPE